MQTVIQKNIKMSLLSIASMSSQFYMFHFTTLNEMYNDLNKGMILTTGKQKL
jgi:hypothetical protein